MRRRERDALWRLIERWQHLGCIMVWQGARDRYRMQLETLLTVIETVAPDDHELHERCLYAIKAVWRAGGNCAGSPEHNT